MRNFILRSCYIAVGISFIEGQSLQAHPPTRVTWAEQGWSQEQRDLYHYKSQGVVMGKIAWFMALEQELSLRLVSDPAYLATFGLINEPASPSNPQGLPVGFAVASDDGQTGIPIPGTWGLTCALCHTTPVRSIIAEIQSESMGGKLKISYLNSSITLKRRCSPIITNKANGIDLSDES